MKSQSKLVNSTRQKDARTYNDGLTNSTSLNNVVDLFFLAGASRTMSEEDIVKMIQRSYTEDSLLTVKCIFWAGNIRGGAGERRFFRIALKFLEDNYKETLLLNLELVPHFNRWDSLFNLESEEILSLVHEALQVKKNVLCAKWMPRKKQYNNFADKFRKKFELNHKQYRNLIVELSNTVEQQMCSKEFSEIKYSTVPSVAMNKYRTAFFRNDEARFKKFIDDVTEGKEEIKAGVLFPYQLYNALKNGDNTKAVEAQWNALPNYMEGNPERVLPVCDVSGSMYGLPLAVSVSLGLYLSERNESIFKDAFVTFSARPKMEYLKGTLSERVRQLEDADWDMNTDLNAVFELVLKRAVDDGLSQDDMPTMLLIISDMEFDECANLTAYDNIKAQYKQAGYVLPKIVFWNVNGRIGNVPASCDQEGVALISGCSPSIMKCFLEGKNITPESIVLETLNNEVYEDIKVANSI